MTRIPLLLFGSALLALSGCSKHPATSPGGANAGRAVQVETVMVRAQEVSTGTEVTGTVRPVQRAQLAAKVMGAIEELPITLGQDVRAGDLLVRIAAGEISARVAQAKAQVNGARRDLEREKTLLTKGASTAETVKNLEDRLTTSEAQLREAEVMLGYAVVRAPFDGVVARRLVNAGDLAAPGAILLEIEGTSRFEVEAGVPESLTPRLKVGTVLRVEVPSAQVVFDGRIAELSSAADPQARTVPLKIAVPEGTAVRSGQFARVEMPGAVRRAIRVPESAVSRLGQMERVFVVSPDHRAVLRLVKTAGTRDGWVEILAGISEGDRVISSPRPDLRDGQPAEAIP